MPVAKDNRHKNAFITPFGLYQFTKMLFGLQGAPATFHRMMNHLIQGLQGFASAYLDNLVIYSDSWEDHLEHLRQVLQRLKEAGLTAKPKKCQFAMEQCTYLGHIVGNGVIKPELDKVETVHSFTTSQTKINVRAFLGLTGYYR